MDEHLKGIIKDFIDEFEEIDKSLNVKSITELYYKIKRFENNSKFISEHMRSLVESKLKYTRALEGFKQAFGNLSTLEHNNILEQK